MTDSLAGRWNERYGQEEYAYGTTPNAFFREQIHRLPPGTALFPAEGEGRNAVYAAQLGWNVMAFDVSETGRDKALRLAQSKDVTIEYQVSDVASVQYPAESFDALVLIYAHFPGPQKAIALKQLLGYLKKGGVVLFEAFSKKHLEYVLKDERIGGPKDLETLYSSEEIREIFSCCDSIELLETEIELQEGLYHNGIGSVIRFTAVKG